MVRPPRPFRPVGVRAKRPHLVKKLTYALDRDLLPGTSGGLAVMSRERLELLLCVRSRRAYVIHRYGDNRAEIKN